MQDIGGCRAVVANVQQVGKLFQLYKNSDLKHPLAHVCNYIEKPKPSGYRSVHLIYKYYSDRKHTYDGLKIEVQLRSALQHAWATAVETVGTFIQQALKSSQGEADWLRFFALMGTAIALREHCNPVPDTPTKGQELKKELKEYAARLDVESHLRAYGAALQTLEQPKPDAHFHYYLLALDPAAKQIKITGYKQTELEKASEDYLAIERTAQSGAVVDAVLVSVDSLTALRRAYPNYFLDTHLFIQAVQHAIA